MHPSARSFTKISLNKKTNKFNSLQDPHAAASELDLGSNSLKHQQQRRHRLTAVSPASRLASMNRTNPAARGDQEGSERERSSSSSSGAGAGSGGRVPRRQSIWGESREPIRSRAQPPAAGRPPAMRVALPAAARQRSS